MTIRIPTDVSLVEGETPIWFGQMSYAANWPLFLLGLLFFWTIIALPLFFILAWINVITSEYFVSNKRIYYKYGLISRVANDLKMEWITNTSILQGFVGRILDFGNVLIATPGTATGASMFYGVSEPMIVKGIIENRLVNYKKIEEISQSLRNITDEYRMGRLEEARYHSLKIDYENEIKKYS